MRAALLFTVAFAVSSPLACDSAGNTQEPGPIADGLPADCSPLRVPGACMMPWPNAIYLKTDGTTATGYRLALDGKTFPVVNAQNTPFDPTRWNLADGFSPAGAVLYYFAERIDPSSLVPETNIAASLKPGAATVLVDMSTNALVAHFSGVDENIRHDTDRQGIIITPVQRLLPDHRYAVAITNAVRTADGGQPTPPPLFQPMLHGLAPSDPMSQAQLARMPAIVASLAAAGVPSENLVVAWDFVTGSDTALTGHVLTMRDQALEAVGPDGAGYTVKEVDPSFDPQVLRRIRGTFTVPQFLDHPDETTAEASLQFDASGNPVLIGSYQAPFTVIVPAVAAQRHPLPIVLYGHGLFGTGDGELDDGASSDDNYVETFANKGGYVVVATDWIGLSAHDSPVDTGNDGAVAGALTNFSHFTWITDRLQQALIANMVLARTMRGLIAKDAAMTVSGQAGDASVADPTRLTYYGISLGGIMGMSFMGYDPDVLKGVLGCGGGFWSTMLERSTDWRLAEAVFPAAYPDPLDQELLLALAQMQFDYSDPATIAPYILKAPLRGTPKKQVLSQMGLNDAQVSNVVTEMIARTEGEPFLSPAVVQPWGITPVKGPLASGVSSWNLNTTPVPQPTNLTPGQDNGVHEGVRWIPQVQTQIDTFFATGQVVDECGGSPCVEPIPPETPDAGAF